MVFVIVEYYNYKSKNFFFLRNKILNKAAFVKGMSASRPQTKSEHFVYYVFVFVFFNQEPLLDEMTSTAAHCLTSQTRCCYCYKCGASIMCNNNF